MPRTGREVLLWAAGLLRDTARLQESKGRFVLARRHRERAEALTAQAALLLPVSRRQRSD